MGLDARVRLHAFGWLRDRMAEHGEVLPRAILAEGFAFEGVRVPLIGPQGIFKPRLCELPLSITTSPNGPYQDAPGADGSIQYRYRGIDPNHPDNVGLRRALATRTPLVYFYGHQAGRYHVVMPVFIVGDDPGALTFIVRVDDFEIGAVGTGPARVVAADADNARRRSITTTVQRRLHQAAFRERVLRAYTGAYALCHLRHAELLDAAHNDEAALRAVHPRVLIDARRTALAASISTRSLPGALADRTCGLRAQTGARPSVGSGPKGRIAASVRLRTGWLPP